MAELTRRKLSWSSLNRFEQLALVSSVLIWLGVALFGGGLYFALRNRNLEQQSLAQATSVALSQPVESTATPTPTPELFAVGWATATATQTPLPTSTPTPGPVVAPPDGDILQPDVTTTATAVPTLSATDLWPASTDRQVEAPAAPPPAAAPPNRIVIPSIELDSSIVPIGWYVVEQDGQRYSVWQVADYAVSWHQTSAYPGHSGNVVLNGHHNIKGEVFRYLVDVEVGDRVLIYVNDHVYYYAVEQKMILKEKGEPPEVRRENATWIAPTQDERLTMVTCWPYTNNTHRLVIVARPAPAPQSAGLEE